VITHFEINGFKTFHKFALDFEPFQIIVGPNAVGKSNLFDALRLLSRLADNDLRTAFQGTESEIVSETMRGEAAELFTAFPDGSASTKMQLSVELLVERQIQDSWGARADLKYTRLRYEIAIERRADERGLERLYVTHERLKPIHRDSDTWVKRHLGNERGLWLPPLKAGRKEDFISTTVNDGVATISLHQDGHGGRKSSVAERVERTV
jgi:predicted ATP-dependent endonuclease of OLD family